MPQRTTALPECMSDTERTYSNMYCGIQILGPHLSPLLLENKARVQSVHLNEGFVAERQLNVCYVPRFSTLIHMYVSHIFMYQVRGTCNRDHLQASEIHHMNRHVAIFVMPSVNSCPSWQNPHVAVMFRPKLRHVTWSPIGRKKMKAQLRSELSNQLSVDARASEFMLGGTDYSWYKTPPSFAPLLSPYPHPHPRPHQHDHHTTTPPHHLANSFIHPSQLCCFLFRLK